MKLITFRHNGQVKAGTLIDEDKITVKDDGPNAANAVRQLIEAEKGIGTWEGGRPSIDLMDVELLAPIPEPRRNIFCVGKNYYAHAKEFNDSGFDSSTNEEVPSAPVIFKLEPDFKKTPSSETFETKLTSLLSEPPISISPLKLAALKLDPRVVCVFVPKIRFFAFLPINPETLG